MLNFARFNLIEASVEMCSPRENARRIVEEMAVAALAMAETTETRLARLESDVAHVRSDVADMKVDIRELRKEIGGVLEKVGGLRTETQKQFGDLRDDMRNEIGGVRNDMHNEIGGVRNDMHKEIGELRDDMRKGFAIIGRSNMQTRIWMLLIGGGILGLMAHALHWL